MCQKILKFSTLTLSSVLCLIPIAANSTVLKYSDHQPLGQMRTSFLDEVLFPAIEKESHGRISIESHWDGELAIAYQALPRLTEGKITDISTIVPEYTAKELPLSQIFKSFPVGPSGDDQVTLIRDIFETVPEFKQEFEENNLEPIFLSTGYPVGFFGTKPISLLDDIKGQKWRSASFWHLDYLKEAGAIPVKTHWSPEIYAMLQDGTLDGIFVNIDSAYNLKLHERARYALISKNLWLGHIYVVAMNKDSYDALDQVDKDAIRRAAVYAYGVQGENMDKHFDSVIDKLRAEGTQIRFLSDNELTQWQMMTNYQLVQKSWARQQTLNGKSNAQSVIDNVTSLIHDR
jgi:TRAP-type C4-dicarboxylate transport system substrate-binding protein